MGKNHQQRRKAAKMAAEEVEVEAWPSRSRSRSGVMLEGYVAGSNGGEAGSETGEGSMGRTKSLTDDDLEELKGCLDLGFGFSYDEIPELCNTLPALELCYSMSQRYLDDQHRVRSPGVDSSEPPSHPVADWKISSPGDDPDEVKARLKYWARAVACTVKLCS